MVVSSKGPASCVTNETPVGAPPAFVVLCPNRRVCTSSGGVDWTAIVNHATLAGLFVNSSPQWWMCSSSNDDDELCIMHVCTTARRRQKNVCVPAIQREKGWKLIEIDGLPSFSMKNSSVTCSFQLFNRFTRTAADHGHICRRLSFTAIPAHDYLSFEWDKSWRPPPE